MSDAQIHFEGLAPLLPASSAQPKAARAGLPAPRNPVNPTSSKNGNESREILFLALLLDQSLFEIVGNRAQLTCRAHGFTRRPIATERLHISLLGFGDYSEARMSEISAIASCVRFPLIDITLDKAMSFQIRGRAVNPFVLTSQSGLEKVREFYRVLSAAFPEKKAGTKINPHLTLIWDAKIVPEYTLTKPLSWTAREFVLVRSFQGQGRYEIVGRWPLATDE